MFKRAVVVPIVVLGIAAILLLLTRRSWTASEPNATVQSTDDAYVRADEIPLSTRVSGTVRSVNVSDYQPVKSGQLLVELNDSDYQAAATEARAALDAAQAEYSANQNAKRVADANVSAAQAVIDQAEAAVTAARAAISSNEATVAQADAEFSRQQALLTEKAATHQQFEQAQASKLSATASLQGHQADLSRAQATAASARAAFVGAKEQREALETKDIALRAQIQAKKAAITVAEVNLSYTKIFAPADGAVGEFRVHPGQLVGVGVQIVSLVQNSVWIQANYRETQLGQVSPGDLVDVHVDAIPGRTFHGHVAEIAPASGSQFALLPPDNATGNYTKVVQRVPVRITLDSDQIMQLRPGFSAEVAIHVSRESAGTQTQLPASSPLR